MTTRCRKEIRKGRRVWVAAAALAVSVAGAGGAGLTAATAPGNRPERLEWFRDAGFGLFVHWSVDSQLGVVISHSVIGATPDYLRRYFEVLPRIFNPRKFRPDDWAVLADLAGMKYLVMNAKHHSGFCMYDTATTAFSVMHTPWGKDTVADVVRAFRERDIAPGFYFSTDDFHFQYTHGQVINRSKTMLSDKAYMDYNRAQIRELLSKYGPIDVLFFDGHADGVRDLAWELQPDVVVTRGAIRTPEQYIPGIAIDTPWEACLTMGKAWQYRPTNEAYKSGTQLIETLIETRAKGGNLLLNVGPKPDGELPIEQEGLLREVGLWNFVNGESIHAVRPWVVTNENDIWFAKKKDEDTVYAFLTREQPWKLGLWKEFTLKSVQTSPQSVVSVLGQTGEVLGRSTEIPRTTWRQDATGLHVRVCRAQRLYDHLDWPNPVVLKITHARPNLVPPQVATAAVRYEPARRRAILDGELRNLGKAPSVEVGFQCRTVGSEAHEPKGEWRDVRYVTRGTTGVFTLEMDVAQEGQAYQCRAVVKHPVITLYGEEKTLRTTR
jgi:alpha-L-fucosidase